MNLQELEERVNQDKKNIDFDKLKKDLSEIEARLQTPEVW